MWTPLHCTQAASVYIYIVLVIAAAKCLFLKRFFFRTPKTRFLESAMCHTSVAIALV